MIAKHTVNLGPNKSYAPGAEFEISDEAEARSLVKSGAAERKMRLVADDAGAAGSGRRKTRIGSDPAVLVLPLKDVLAMADDQTVTLDVFRAAAERLVSDDLPETATKDEIVAALLALPPEA